MSKKLSIILRGHIRGSFDNDDLYDYVKDLDNEYDLTIYIQTWNIIQTNVSWRYMEKNENVVTEDLINDYFDDLSGNINKIIILDDSKIELIGKTTGRMGKTSGSNLGWKQMWYGIYEIAEYVKNTEPEHDNFVINTRFDVFNNSVSFSKDMIVEKLNDIMHSSLKPETIKKNIFLKDLEFFGIDNFYIGNSNTIFKLAERFYFNLDEIVIKYPKVTSHEFYTFHVNNLLFLDNWLINKKLSTYDHKSNIDISDINIEKKHTVVSLFDKPQIKSSDKNPLLISLLNEPQKSVYNNFPTIDKNDLLHFSGGVRSTELINFYLNENSTTISDNTPNHSFSNNNDQVLISYQGNKLITTLSDTKYKTGEKLLISVENDYTNQKKQNDPILLKSGQGKSGKLIPLEQNDNFDKSETIIVEPPKLLNFQQPHYHITKMDLFNPTQTIDITDSAPSELTPLLTLPSTQTRGAKLDLFEASFNIDSDNKFSESTRLLTLPSAQVRGGQLALFETSSHNGITDNVTIENSHIPKLTSSQSRGAKLDLFDPTEKTSSALTVAIDSTQPLLLTSLNKNNKVPLFDSNLPVPSVSSVSNESKQLLTLSSTQQSKGNKMVLFDSTTPLKSEPIANKEEVLYSSNVGRRGGSSLIKTEAVESTIKLIDTPTLMSSKTQRSSKPLINVDKVDNSSTVYNNNGIALLNKNVRSNNSKLIIEDASVNKTIEPASKSSDTPLVSSNKDKIVDKPIETTIIYLNATIPIITKPIPISKFSVSLDPNYINIKDSSLTLSNPVNLISNNKFKTNTQSLNSYYALLAN